MPLCRGGLILAGSAAGVGLAWSQGQNRHLAVALGAVVILGGACHVRRYWRARSALGPKQLIALTGCDSGLGYSLAVHCRARGATVVAGVLQEDGPAALDLRNRGARVARLDITEEQSVDRFGKELERILEEEKLELLALVNNAGVMVFGEFEWQLGSQVRSQLEVNVLGTMSVTRCLLPLIRRHASRIVNVTSHCAEAPLPGLAAYGASKAALQAWSTSLRVELRKYGVQVVAFIPGSFARESNLLAHQQKHFDDMRSAMSEEARQFYGDYFERYAAYLNGLSGEKGLQRLEIPQLYEAFEGALLDKRPSAAYKCEPWRYTFYHTLFRLTPTGARDWLVERFVLMPSWSHRSSQPQPTTSRQRDADNEDAGSRAS